MNGILKVEPEKLISASQEFSNSSSVVNGLTTQMTGIVDGLSSIWTGEAAQAYRNKFHQLDDDITRMNKMIQEHVQDLQAMAASFKQAENEAQQIASALPGDVIN